MLISSLAALSDPVQVVWIPWLAKILGVLIYYNRLSFYIFPPSRPLSSGWCLSIKDYKRELDCFPWGDTYQLEIISAPKSLIDKRHPEESGLVYETNC